MIFSFCIRKSFELSELIELILCNFLNITGKKVILSIVAGNTKANIIPAVTPTSGIICSRLGIAIANPIARITSIVLYTNSKSSVLFRQGPSGDLALIKNVLIVGHVISTMTYCWITNPKKTTKTRRVFTAVNCLKKAIGDDVIRPFCRQTMVFFL